MEIQTKFDFASIYASVREEAGFKNRIAAITEAIRFWNDVEWQFKNEELKSEILSYALGVAGSHDNPIQPEELVQMTEKDEEPMVLGSEHKVTTPDTETPYSTQTEYSPTSTVLATRISSLTYREVQRLAEEMPSGVSPDALVDWAEWVKSNDLVEN